MLRNSFRSFLVTVQSCSLALLATTGSGRSRGSGSSSKRRSALAEESRLEEMLGDLLLLASVEEAPATAHTEVDLAAVAAAVAERSRPVPVTVRGRGTARGSRAQLERVVTNLIDNAARHATAAVRVTVDGSRIEVDDDGPGVAEPDRDRVFERFTRCLLYTSDAADE